MYFSCKNGYILVDTWVLDYMIHRMVIVENRKIFNVLFVVEFKFLVDLYQIK